VPPLTRFYQATETTFNKRIERVLGEQGQIAHDIDPIIERIKDNILDERNLLSLLRIMAQGSRLSFDRRTHRQAWRRYDRLNYAFLASKLMEDTSPQHVTEDVVEHLVTARAELETAWGKMEFLRIGSANATLANLDEELQKRFADRIGPEHFEEIRNLVLTDLDPMDKAEVISVLGERLQNEIYRSLLLSAISEQWVEYLTKVEGLRVSIGMEAYAQRDPLVQLQIQASELFTQLLADISRRGDQSHVHHATPAR